MDFLSPAGYLFRLLWYSTTTQNLTGETHKGIGACTCSRWGLLLHASLKDARIKVVLRIYTLSCWIYGANEGIGI